MTDPIFPARNAHRSGWGERAILLLILFGAVAIRVRGVGFGLPALNDPDEPLFVMIAIDMLRSGSLNPGWFGHPATLTFYALALVTLAVGGIGIATGRFADVDAFVAAVYADPAILFVPARLFFVACGVLCVFLTWRLGRRLGGPRLGLIAAALLAANAIHVEYSQLIRTDVQASVFILLATLAALDILERGRLRDHAAAGAFVALGIATKWPAALIALNPLVAALWRAVARGPLLRPLAVLGVSAAATLVVVSPYLLLDHATVAQNLAGEARPLHPGATGGEFLANLAWYVRGPLLESLGWLGMAAVAAGVVLTLRSRQAVIAVLPGVVALALVICAQALVWERWLVPLLPFLALAAAGTICALADLLRKRLSRALTGFEPLATLLLLVPMVAATNAGYTERANDTRQAASAWIEAHAPRGATILVEHAAIDLIQHGWRLRFPLGTAGCIDARDALAGKISYGEVEKKRTGRAVVDLGHVAPERLPSCRADFAIFTHYDVYRAAPRGFEPQLRVYQAMAAGGRVRAVIRPEAGRRGGPVVHIVELRPR
ncbi:glycosyltransferase family 39 protein [Sphingomonas sp. BT-65]|uniref:ArnT family glycosyltransferase n=1 Tax=Sphingomonas sp. BT-65 TaxID=2989821 RepID=UPI0022366FF8|nr:glycosyltransferase family 39 protein [Sphingomonas sp. BT-65]MCW4461027.1 glycosyltransferase family 39 protein [Sphingomonas sp. BT-65]